MLIFSFSGLLSFAHSGRTDSKGGHYDQDAGEYHYHHGYPAHEHENGICPYDYDDKTESKDYLNSSKHQNTHSKSKKPETWMLIVIPIFIAVSLFIIFTALLMFAHSTYLKEGHGADKLLDCSDKILKTYVMDIEQNNNFKSVRNYVIGSLIGFVVAILFLVLLPGTNWVPYLFLITVAFSMFFLYYDRSYIKELVRNSKFSEENNMQPKEFLKCIRPVRFSYWIFPIYSVVLSIMLFVVYFTKHIL